MCYVRIPVFTVWKVFGSHVFLNKRRLTGNRLGSERRETGRKKLLPQHPYLRETYKVAELNPARTQTLKGHRKDLFSRQGPDLPVTK